MTFDEVAIYFCRVTRVKCRVRNAEFCLYEQNIFNIVAYHFKSIVFHIFDPFLATTTSSWFPDSQCRLRWECRIEGEPQECHRYEQVEFQLDLHLQYIQNLPVYSRPAAQFYACLLLDAMKAKIVMTRMWYVFHHHPVPTVATQLLIAV